MEIENKTGKQWVLHFEDYLLKKFSKSGMQKGELYPSHWTSDSAYLYFKSYIYTDVIGGICIYGAGNQGLYRINVNTGEVSAILPPTTTFYENDIAFSPDGSKLAYNANHPTILDLRTGENITIDDDGDVLISMIWSPDGTHLAYATCHPSGGFTVKNSALKIFSLETYKSKTILTVENALILIEFGDGNHQLKIRIDDYQSRKPYYSFFDWSSEQLIKLTITPTP